MHTIQEEVRPGSFTPPIIRREALVERERRMVGRRIRAAKFPASWAGLTPRQHSTGGKTRLGRTSKMGQKDIRRLLIIGAMSSHTVTTPVTLMILVHAAILRDRWESQQRRGGPDATT
jgi:transposase